MTTTTVQPEKILRDLRDLWAQLGREQESSGGVLRACALNLLVVAEDLEPHDLDDHAAHRATAAATVSASTCSRTSCALITAAISAASTLICLT